jgi:uncharacterized membrane protein YesL
MFETEDKNRQLAENKTFWTEWQQAFPKSNLLSIFSCTEF